MSYENVASGVCLADKVREKGREGNNELIGGASSNSGADTVRIEGRGNGLVSLRENANCECGALTIEVKSRCSSLVLRGGADSEVRTTTINKLSWSARFPLRAGANC